MKKTLVALAVMVAAGSANAGIELYNKDGVTVNVKSDFEVRYKKGTNDGDELKQEIDDAEFGFDTRYAMDDSTQVGFYMEFTGVEKDRAASKAGVKNVYVGFYNDQFGSFKVGKLDTVLDDAGVGSDYLFGVNSFVKQMDFNSDEAIRYDLDKGNFYASFALTQDKHETKLLGKDGRYFDLKAGYRVADFDFTAFLGQAKFEKGAIAGVKETLGALEGVYKGVENVTLEAGYYMAKTSPKTGSDKTDNTMALAADYTMNAWKFATGFSVTNYDDSSKDKLNKWFLNAGYTIAPSTTTYVEIGGNNGDKQEVGYGVGIKASF
ncbi:porin [Vibrio tapetis]|uniref:Porin-like protein H n=2 Tax=Vibrio tapetis TaxID=52443 RepID=A0A0A1EC96_9VIBR|nr:porin [Vibrio tapetis]AIY26154.1 porin-like protein H [Vibrio tapetis]SON49055.1 putative OMPH_PHOPR Porin-like protein H [Vibrio tapetis subsp. tapetis]